ncbi:MAG: hypothetical protein IKM24_01665 [Clostridia bacterium]|nr:hypothetical protein [Clostridia bacterium]
MVCPKCGVPIKRFDLAPNCKQCGVHIMYYTQEEDLARDAKLCELEFAKTRAFVDKIKVGFVKNRFSLARMIIIIVGIAFLFIPYSDISAALPLRSFEFTLSGWGIYKLVSDGLLMQLPNILNSEIASELTGFLLAEIAVFLVAFLALLGVFCTCLIGFLNVRKSCRVMIGFSCAAGILCIAGAVLAFILQSKAAAYSMFSASVGAGFFTMTALLVVLIVVNVLLYRDNPQPQTKPIDLERIAILKKVKSGEVSIDDLSLPVCYSEEEELARTQFIGTSKKKAKKSKKGGNNNG